MLERIGLPIAFVVLWSSAFVAAKSGVAYATPFAFLAVRFAIVAAIFAAVSVVVAVWRHQRKMAQSASPAITRRGLIRHHLRRSFTAWGFILDAAFMRWQTDWVRR
jgi:drug/metabolite transporter (DMT)-like permease